MKNLQLIEGELKKTSAAKQKRLAINPNIKSK